MHQELEGSGSDYVGGEPPEGGIVDDDVELDAAAAVADGDLEPQPEGAEPVGEADDAVAEAGPDASRG